MSLYKLRDSQQQAYNALKQSFTKGNHRPLLYASVAFGKTVLAAHIVSGALEKGKRVCFVVPFTVLINQTAASFLKQGLEEPGIIQADHPMTDASKPLQIASVQTLARRARENFDLYIVDECHVIYKEIAEIAAETNTPMIGLSGSPFSRGLGKIYNDLVKAKSMKDLIKDGELSDYIAFGPDAPDMHKVTTTTNQYGEKDFKSSENASMMSDAKVIGSVTKNWLELGNNEPTICYAVNIAHANYLGSAFDQLNVTNQVITHNTSREDREEYFEAFSKGAIKILINVGTLTTGMDRDVRCIIFARPTNSRILWVQMGGRAFRTCEGKGQAIMIDHSGNFERLGYPEDITIDSLDQNEKGHPEAIRQEKEEKEHLPTPCPKCKILKAAGVHECPECGFMPRVTINVEEAEGDLAQIKGKSREKTRAEKQDIYSQLKGYQNERFKAGKKISDGWVAHTYKEIIGVWPQGLLSYPKPPEDMVRGWIKHKNIKYSKRKKS